jgi:beta-1,4-mannosyltransferase
METIRVFPIPFKNKNNPYLDLLYTHLERINDGTVHQERKYRVQKFSWRKVFAALFRRERVIVHIHWETALYGSRYWIVAAGKMGWWFGGLLFARACGARIVWTMHNLHAHDFPFTGLDSFGRFCMRQLADAVIIQNHEYQKTFLERFPKISSVYIPHGNYSGVYGTYEGTQDEARAALGISMKSQPAKFQPTQPSGSQSDILLLALGAIRPYKNLESLIDAVKVTNLFLVIAGKGESEYTAALSKRAEASSRILLKTQFVPDEQIPLYLKAADYAVYTHGDSSLTSGALILALSYGTPILTLSIPAAELIQEGKNGYVAKDIAGFDALLRRLPELAIPSYEEVFATVASDTWSLVAENTGKLYDSLFVVS